VTRGNRQNLTDATDCGGRLGPHLKDGGPDLRNVALYFHPCEEGDYFIMVSDGVHDNLDPQTLGYRPEDLNEQLKDLSWNQVEESEAGIQTKTNFMTTLLRSIMITEEQEPSAVSMVENVIDYATTTTDSSRGWMESNPEKHLPVDYVNFPGKLDHTTCTCFQVISNLHTKNTRKVKDKATTKKSFFAQ